MSISTVATRIGIALDPHTSNFIRSELTVRRNEMWAQGCSRLQEDEIIETLMDDLFVEAPCNTIGDNTTWLTEQDIF